MPEQRVEHHPWQKGQSDPMRRVNSRMADDNVCKLTPQWGLWEFSVQPKRPFIIPIPRLGVFNWRVLFSAIVIKTLTTSLKYTKYGMVYYHVLQYMEFTNRYSVYF